VPTIDEVREYWDRRPCNLKHSPKPVGSREYFEEVEKRKYFVEPHIPAFANFPHWKNKKVLEIGCGIGTDTINFAREGAQVTAVDLSKKSLEIAERRAEIFACSSKIRFFEADAETLSSHLTPEAFDLIYSFGVIHHSPDPRRIFQEIRRHFVHPQSELRIMLYNPRSFKVLEMLLKNLRWAFRLKELIPKYSEAQPNSPVTHAFSRFEWKRLLTESGFAIISEEKTHIFPYEIEAYKDFRYVKTWYFKFLPHFIFRGLEKLLGWHWLVIARPNATPIETPERLGEFPFRLP
jgi:SAM-dependent methyltransferase